MQSEKLIINELKPQTALLYKRQKYRPAINSTILRYPHKTSTLRSNRNISALKDGTLKSAKIVSFRQSQSIDNQCLFFCQNVTSFTGKEKDSETGFYYFGARYYDPALSGLFISIDPMSDKYPSLSPYAYCAWNPVKLVDPDGMDALENDDWYKDENECIKWDENVTSPDNTPANCQYLGSEGFAIDETSGELIHYSNNGEIERTAIELEQVIIYPETGDNNVLNILKAGSAIALTTSQLDSPIPGPADVAAVGIGALTLITASVVWAIDQIFHPFAHDSKKNGKLTGARSDRHDGQYVHGGKNRQENPNQRKGAERRKNKGKRIN